MKFKKIFVTTTLLLITFFNVSSSFAMDKENRWRTSITPSLFDQAKKVFDPESAHFSQRETIKSWLATKYHNDPDLLRHVQFYLNFENPEHPHSQRTCVLPIKNNEGDDRHFGRTSPALESVQLSCLQFGNKVSRTKSPVVLEIAAGIGGFAWKLPYAFENTGQVFVNELSSPMLKILDEFLDVRLPSHLRQLVHKTPGDCFKILENRPELVGKCDVIYVQNFEHFRTPKEHQQFLSLVAELLAPLGRAFLTSHTLPPQRMKIGTPFCNVYMQAKESGEVYPGFIKYTMESHDLVDELSGEIEQISEKIIGATRPDESLPCSTKIISTTHIDNYKTNSENKKLIQVEQVAIGQFFTPAIYKNAVSFHPTLKLIESYFMGKFGHRHDKFCDKSVFATAIIEKNLR